MSKLISDYKLFAAGPAISGCVQVYTRNRLWLCCTVVDRDVTCRTGSEAWSEFVPYCSELFRLGYSWFGTIFGYSSVVHGGYSGSVVSGGLVLDSVLW